jgi:hypothetical protein
VCTRLAVASDKAYQLLAHGRWFSPGTPASSTTNTGRHDIAEILLKVALNKKYTLQLSMDLNVLQLNCSFLLKYFFWRKFLFSCYIVTFFSSSSCIATFLVNTIALSIKQTDLSNRCCCKFHFFLILYPQPFCLK